jgi:hypothetical protein
MAKNYLKYPKPGNIKSNYKLPLGIIVLIKHIVTLGNNTIVITHKYLESM